MSTCDAAVVTAIYDFYESVKPVLDQDGADVDWVLVTDNPLIAEMARENGWRPVVEPRPGIHPNRAAKRPKFQPWFYTEAKSSVWIDGSYRVVSESFVEEVMVLADPIAQFVHPWRDCALAEGEFSRGLAKYAGEPLDRQLAYYRGMGHPEHWGLWAAGVIARRHTPEVIAFGDMWAREVGHWSFQDQVSEPVVLRQFDLRPTPLPGNHLDNPWLSYEGSARH